MEKYITLLVLQEIFLNLSLKGLKERLLKAQMRLILLKRVK